MHRIYKQPSDFDTHLTALLASDELVVDIETTGLNTRKDKILGIGLSNGDNAAYLMHLSYDKGSDKLIECLDHASVKPLLKSISNTRITTWNGAFDLPFIKHYFNIDLLPNLHTEGMLLVHTCDENKFNYGLKDIATSLFGADATKEQEIMHESIKENGGTSKEFWKADSDLMALYCMKDCVLTERVVKAYMPQLINEGLRKFFFEDEVMPLYREVTIPMEQAGIKLDMPMLLQAQSELGTYMIELEQRILTQIEPYLAPFYDYYFNKEYAPSRTGDWAQAIVEYAGLSLPRTKTGKYQIAAENVKKLPDSIWKSVLLQESYIPEEHIKPIQMLLHQKAGGGHPFNISSTHHLKRLFFNILQLEPLSKTPTGQPQVDNEFLESVKSKYEFVALLIEYRSLLKIKGTYIDRFVDEQEDGRFYPKYFQHRTVSGRHSGDFQQLPRPLEDGQDAPSVVKYTNMIRMFFIADEGYNLIGADYESLEPHVFAHVSGDEKLINIFKQGHDFYSTIAIDTEGLKDVSPDKNAPNYLGKVSKAHRQRAKSYSLGIPYGLSGYKLQFEIGCTQEEGDRLVRQYLEAYPQLAEWMKQSEKQCIERGFVKTESGRKRRFPNAPRLARKYGCADDLLDSLQLWKNYHEHEKMYEQAKKDRGQLKNMLNNAKNVQIQGLAASIVARSAIALSREIKKQGLNAQIVGAIHDELLVSCSETDTQKAVDIMQNIMENTYKLSLRLKAEPHVAKRYGETK